MVDAAQDDPRLGSLGFLLKHAFLDLDLRITEALGSLGVDSREFGVMVVIAAGEPNSQQHLAERMGIDRTTMVALLDALEGKKIVTRRAHAADRRRNVVVLTPAGAQVLDRGVELRAAVECQFLAPLSDSAARGLRRALRRLHTARGDVVAPPPP